MSPYRQKIVLIKQFDKIKYHSTVWDELLNRLENLQEMVLDDVNKYISITFHFVSKLFYFVELGHFRPHKNGKHRKPALIRIVADPTIFF